ncbi:MAG TPA: NAD-dependent dehydratase, partial [Mycobacterium sp.]|nr:NAD-dependent dehydratase [Mycobacterium sp.]
SSWVARLRGRATKLTPLSIRLMHIMTPLDHSKAIRELGWHPSPTADAIIAAAHFFKESR